ncbi:putative trypsin-6 [Pholidichthys leucotaenia]
MMNLFPSCYRSLVYLLVLKLTGVCGSRIIGGQEVNPNTIEYQASVIYRGSHVCGGTLIAPTWVATAGHCWRAVIHLAVQLGKHYIFREEENEQTIKVSSVYRHPEYSHWRLDNDIMLLKLEHPAVINAVVKPATLPDLNTPPLKYLSQCTVSGWGVTWVLSPSLSPELRSVNVEIFSNCWKYYYFRVTDNMICAGSRHGGKDSCQGDSGGPLICNGKFEGIVSWGIGCAYSFYPGVYTKVRNYMQWINEMTQPIE